MSLTKFKCKNCLAELAFNPATQKWDCEYCHSSFSLEELSDIEQSFEDSVNQGEQPPVVEELKEDDLVVYQCPNCGAEILADKDTSATFCLYCKHPTVIPQQFRGDFKPQYIIPFMITKEEAIAEFERMISKKRFISKDFKNKKTLSEIKGIYVPFWLYSVLAKGKGSYDCENVTTSTSGNMETIRTDYYTAFREMEVFFSQIPIDASEKMDDSLMTSVEPYYYAKMVPFKSSYLAGFFSERYSTSKDVAENRARERAQNSFLKCMDDSVNFSSKRRISQQVDCSDSVREYALLPVYIITVKYKGKPYIYAINGQTGKVAGNIPIYYPKVFLYGAGMYLGISLITRAITIFFSLLG